MSIMFEDLVLKPSFFSKREIGPITLCIDGCRRVLLLGPSGSGKSTLFRYISGSIFPQVKKKGASYISAQSISYLTQDYPFYGDLTVGELFIQQSLMSRTKEMERKKIQTHLHLEPILSNRFRDQLSGGQRRLVQFGLELLFKPDVMLLDEPFTGLDSEMVMSTLSMLDTIHKEHPCLLVVVGHQLTDAALNFFDYTILLNNFGKTILDCPQSQLEETISRFNIQDGFPPGFSIGEKLLKIAHTDNINMLDISSTLNNVIVKQSATSRQTQTLCLASLLWKKIYIFYANVFFPILCTFKHFSSIINNVILPNNISFLIVLFSLLSPMTPVSFAVTITFLNIYTGTFISKFPDCSTFEWRVSLMNQRITIADLYLKEFVALLIYNFPIRCSVIVLLTYLNDLRDKTLHAIIVMIVFSIISMSLSLSMVLLGVRPSVASNLVLLYGGLSILVSGFVFEWDTLWTSFFEYIFISIWGYNLLVKETHFTHWGSFFTSAWPLYIGILFYYIYYINYKLFIRNSLSKRKTLDV